MKNFIEINVGGDTVLINVFQIESVKFTDEGSVISMASGETMCPDCDNLFLKGLLEKALQV